MHYETFDLNKHDLMKVSQLVYDVDYRSYDMFYKNKDKAVSAISRDLKRRKFNPFFKLVFDGDEIIGVLIIYTKESPHDFNLKALRLFLVELLDYFVLCDIGEGDFYIAQIAIDESLRGKGFGKQVLNDAIEYARSKNYKRVILDADFRNTGAKSLYERVGFKQFNKKSVRFPGFERGMYNMELIL